MYYALTKNNVLEIARRGSKYLKKVHGDRTNTYSEFHA